MDLEHRLASAGREAEDKERATETLKTRVAALETSLAQAAAAPPPPAQKEAGGGGEDRISALEVERDALSAQLRVATSSLERARAERDAAVEEAAESGGDSLGGGGSGEMLELKKQVGV